MNSPIEKYILKESHFYYHWLYLLTPSTLSLSLVYIITPFRSFFILSLSWLLLTRYPLLKHPIIILRPILLIFHNRGRCHFCNASTNGDYYFYGTVANFPCFTSKKSNWLIILFIDVTFLLFIPCIRVFFVLRLPLKYLRL